MVDIHNTDRPVISWEGVIVFRMYIIVQWRGSLEVMTMHVHVASYIHTHNLPDMLALKLCMSFWYHGVR